MPRLKGEILVGEIGKSKTITNKMKVFAAEYLVDLDSVRAATVAGYKNPATSGPVIARHPEVKRIVDRVNARMLIKCELSKERILQELSYCAFRDAGELVDDTGTVKGNIKELPEHTRRAIDGIKQKVRVYYDDEGNETHRDIETELKLVSKAQAIDMCMKHFGAYAAEKIQQEVLVKINWDDLYAPPKKTPVILSLDKIEENPNEYISGVDLADDPLDALGEESE